MAEISYDTLCEALCKAQESNVLVIVEDYGLKRSTFERMTRFLKAAGEDFVARAYDSRITLANGNFIKFDAKLGSKSRFKGEVMRVWPTA